MATRSFTVFQDTPSSTDTAPARKLVRAGGGVLTRSASTSNVNILSSDMAVAIDKENFNPLTGQRSSLNTIGGEKKRKTTVLALKAHVSSASKKQKSTEHDLKKRKTGASKSKSSSSKDRKISGSGRKTKRTSPTRRVSSLPKVVEESTNDPVHGLSQAAIDSRCYELTVIPLADVSEAYEATASLNESISETEQGPFQTVKESSVEPELGDYFSPTNSLTSLASSRLGYLAEDDEDNVAHRFSTPERKKIYASFTFSSPSPSGKRFRESYDLRPASPTPKKAVALGPAASNSVERDVELTVLHS